MTLATLPIHLKKVRENGQKGVRGRRYKPCTKDTPPTSENVKECRALMMLLRASDITSQLYLMKNALAKLTL